jgi:hypothetical protein
MLSFKDFLNLDETNLEEDLHRFDSKLIRNPKTNFNDAQNSYYNSPHHGVSGIYFDSGRRVSRVKNKVVTATYAGTPEHTARYAAPRDVKQTVHHDPKSGNKIITFQKSDEEHIRKHRPILSVWNSRDAHKAKFKNTRDAEFRSETPGRPSSQKIIHDPIKHMEKHGYQVNFVKDIESHAKKLHKKDIPFDFESLDFSP